MREIVFLVGLPGSGKTTMARKMSKDLGYYHFEYDEFLLDREKYSDLWTKPRVIMDAWYKNTKELLEAVNQAKQLGYSKIDILHLAVPKEVCLDRIRQRDQNRPDNRVTVDISNHDNKYHFDIIIDKIKDRHTEVKVWDIT